MTQRPKEIRRVKTASPLEKQSGEPSKRWPAEEERKDIFKKIVNNRRKSTEAGARTVFRKDGEETVPAESLEGALLVIQRERGGKNMC